MSVNYFHILFRCRLNNNFPPTLHHNNTFFKQEDAKMTRMKKRKNQLRANEREITRGLLTDPLRSFLWSRGFKKWVFPPEKTTAPLTLKLFVLDAWTLQKRWLRLSWTYGPCNKAKNICCFNYYSLVPSTNFIFLYVCNKVLWSAITYMVDLGQYIRSICVFFS